MLTMDLDQWLNHITGMTYKDCDIFTAEVNEMEDGMIFL